jgi:hypothetical protein
MSDKKLGVMEDLPKTLYPVIEPYTHTPEDIEQLVLGLLNTAAFFAVESGMSKTEFFVKSAWVFKETLNNYLSFAGEGN